MLHSKRKRLHGFRIHTAKQEYKGRSGHLVDGKGYILEEVTMVMLFA